MRTYISAPWMAGTLLAALLVALPYFYYRQSYTHAKRLRPIVEGRVYRAGTMTALGLRETIQKYGIRTVINLQEEAVDPDLRQNYFDSRTTPESALCQSLGARLVFVFVDLVSPERARKERPATVDEFLAIMDQPANYPVLIHCKAGLHRTGCLSAVYRMEYQGWSPLEAWRELRAHGFGEFASDANNPYITQYVLGYKPGLRHGQPVHETPTVLGPSCPVVPVSTATGSGTPGVLATQSSENR